MEKKPELVDVVDALKVPQGSCQQAVVSQLQESGVWLVTRALDGDRK